MPLLSAQEILMLDDDEVIIYHANKAPIRARRMDIRRFSKLEARMSKVAPAIAKLPPLHEDALAPLQQATGDESGFVNPERYLQ